MELIIDLTSKVWHHYNLNWEASQPFRQNLQPCKNQTTNHMAIKKKNPILNKTAQDEDESDGGVAPEEDEDTEAPVAKPGTKVKVKANVKAVANEELVALFESFDEGVREAEKKLVELCEFINEQQLDKATVVASMMQARGIDYSTALTQYSRMKKMFNNEEVFEELKSGKISLKVAREKTKGSQKNPKSAKPEAKEQRFTTTMKAFVAAAKESGFARKEIMVSVEAELRSAGIK